MKYTNPRISYDNKYWYLCVGTEQDKVNEDLTDISLGIDLGVKDLEVYSNGDVYKNMNKTYVVRKIEKRLKRLKETLSTKKFCACVISAQNFICAKIMRRNGYKYENNKKGKEFVKTKNIIKLEKQIQLIYRRLANIRNNYIHQTTTNIVKIKPCKIVIEDLNVKGMMKNKHLSDSIRKQSFYEFRGIELVIADRFYPSSKTCSCCGNIKKDLKLKDRVYHCECGFAIDRDLNASINLSRYKLA